MVKTHRWGSGYLAGGQFRHHSWWSIDWSSSRGCWRGGDQCGCWGLICVYQSNGNNDHGLCRWFCSRLCGGFAGGFVGGAGNAWLGGASFGDGLVGGLKADGIGGVTGGLINGISSGFRAVKEGKNFWSGVDSTPHVDKLNISSKGIIVENTKPLVGTNGLEPIDVQQTPDFNNPTGLPMRGADPQGAGHYGASRGTRLHTGIDIQSVPGQEILSPVNGTAVNYKGCDNRIWNDRCNSQGI